MRNYFITGTDTDSGKTLITCALMVKMKEAGFSVNAMKPIAAGISILDEGNLNEDVVMLHRYASMEVDYRLMNPYLFEPAIAPHLAAKDIGVVIESNIIKEAYEELLQQADVTLVEGAGGWLVPLSKDLDVGDMPTLLSLPVILVVGLKLGCINHTRLTINVMRSQGVEFSGWIGTQVEKNMSALQGNIDSLKEIIDVPCLGIVPFDKNIDASKAAQYLTLPA